MIKSPPPESKRAHQILRALNKVNIGAWLSPVEHTVRDREVESSNLSAPTRDLPASPTG